MKSNTQGNEKFFWRQSKRNKREVNICVHMLFGGLLAVAVSSTALAGAAAPNMDQPVYSGISTGLDAIDPVTQSGNTTTINQTVNSYADINWVSFNTNASHTVNFNQGGSNYVAVNRIGGAQTQFLGTLNANGQIVLINQNGFFFGDSANINVGSLLATTNTWTKYGEIPSSAEGFASWSEQQWAENYAEIINNGNITITENNGFGFLVAPYVENNGTIKNAADASNVRVGLASIDFEELVPVCDGPCPVTPEVRSGLLNTGTLQGHSGFVAMVGAIYDATVKVGGTLDADQFAQGDDGGTILIKSKGDIELDGANIHAIGGQHVRAILTAEGDIRSTEGTTSNINLQASAGADGAEGWRLWNDYVTADLEVTAGNDINLNSDITVKADAYTAISGSSYSSSSGYGGARAQADFEAGGAIYLATGSDTIRVEATNDSNLLIDGYEGWGWSYVQGDADAELNIHAQNDVTINGHVVVKATSTGRGVGSGYSSSSGSADIDADAELDIRGNDIYLGSAGTPTNIDVTAVATAEGDHDIDADTDIDVDIRGGWGEYENEYIDWKGREQVYTDSGYFSEGSISHNGNLTVVGEAKSTYGDSDVDINVDIEAAGDVTLTGNTSVDATTYSQFNHADEAEIDLDIRAGESLDLELLSLVDEAEEGAPKGSILVQGNITTKSTSTTDAAYEDTDAENDIDIYARYDVTLNGDLTATAVANSGPTGDYAESDSDVTIRAGTYGEGSVSITGDITVSADSDSGGDSAYADADLDINAADDITINGNTQVVATADSNYSARANAWLGMGARGDVTVNGNLKSAATSKSNWDGAEGYASISVNGDGEFDNLHSGDYFPRDYYPLEGGSVTINGDISALASASTNTGYYYNTNAYASVDVMAAQDVTIRGDSTVTATATATDGGEGWTQSYANARMSVMAGQGMFGKPRRIPVPAIVGPREDGPIILPPQQEYPPIEPGNLSYTGDVTITSSATGDEARAMSDGQFIATGSVFIDTDPFISSANATGSYSSWSDAALTFCAGASEACYADGGEGIQLVYAEDIDPQDLTILGDVLSNARSTTLDGAEGDATAFTGLFASGDISVRYHTAPPTAQATHNGQQARVSGDATAYQDCTAESCDPVTPGIGMWNANAYEPYYWGDWYRDTPYSGRNRAAAQLVIQGASVDIAPKPNTVSGPNVLFALDQFERPSGVPGNQPLRFGANGDMFVATGVGVTQPPSIMVMNTDIEEALAAGADPSTLLLPTAAGPGSQAGLASGQDSLTMTGPDFCDSLVSGACLASTGNEGNSQ